MNPAFVFDLDNTLFETRSIPASITSRLFDSMRAANIGDDAVDAGILERAFHDSWSIPFPVVAVHHQLPKRLLSVWTEFHQSLTFPEPLNPFPDVVETLQLLRSRGHFLCLLTSGYRRVQLAKVDALGLGTLFDLILVDAMDENHPGKEKILADLLESHSWQPANIIIIGDSPTSEIAAGVRLGIPTVQILRPGVERTEAAGRHIHSLTELL